MLIKFFRNVISYLALFIGFCGWLMVPLLFLALLPVTVVVLCMVWFFVKVVIENDLDEQMEGY